MTKGFCSVLRCVHRNTFEWENMPCSFREQPPGAARPGLPPGLLRAAAQGNPLGQPLRAARRSCPPGLPAGAANQHRFIDDEHGFGRCVIFRDAGSRCSQVG